MDENTRKYGEWLLNPRLNSDDFTRTAKIAIFEKRAAGVGADLNAIAQVLFPNLGTIHLGKNFGERFCRLLSRPDAERLFEAFKERRQYEAFLEQYPTDEAVKSSAYVRIGADPRATELEREELNLRLNFEKLAEKYEVDPELIFKTLSVEASRPEIHRDPTEWFQELIGREDLEELFIDYRRYKSRYVFLRQLQFKTSPPHRLFPRKTNSQSKITRLPTPRRPSLLKALREAQRLEELRAQTEERNRDKLRYGLIDAIGEQEPFGYRWFLEVTLEMIKDQPGESVKPALRAVTEPYGLQEYLVDATASGDESIPELAAKVRDFWNSRVAEMREKRGDCAALEYVLRDVWDETVNLELIRKFKTNYAKRLPSESEELDCFELITQALKVPSLFYRYIKNGPIKTRHSREPKGSRGGIEELDHRRWSKYGDDIN